ncbi:isopentenyl-diphosphate delta-isomerase, type 2 [Pyrolobus fumarii 1A]|uniref:Isopentenyl-diphosphate delta-isomerase n=1 Tax=Pyrolobus fumarii (strain DSM 11204 / 1A) TaxID=694429 RepID=G0EE91_PYRF1|nr:type 2 isopentenyl-diphosphate Delta-isomerase [Pyrolobus fumarii]AEM38785.1 isopentenyl-diphosphate delta-isomerase, type 2 [Pyrolobus fumarii 1A]
MRISNRKLDHLLITTYYDVNHSVTTLLEEVLPVPRAAPEASLDEVDPSITLFGKRIAAPVIVSGMTGGHHIALEINRAIAEVVEELGLGMGVGSQRAAVKDPSLIDTYRVVRRVAPNALIIGNIGAAQLAKMSIDDVEKLVSMIEADALAVHLNVPQELFQPEGDRDFRGVIKAIEKIVEKLSVPVIVKETGHSIDPVTVSKLVSIGVEYIDVSGAGGTSWVRVEELRARNAGEASLAREASVYRNWGLPTAVAIVAARWAAPTACILAGGGVWNGLDALRALMLGADAVTVALPVLRAYADNGVDGVMAFLSRYVSELRKGMLMVGARTLRDLYATDYALGPRLSSYIESLGIDPELYKYASRARLYTSRACP